MLALAKAQNPANLFRRSSVTHERRTQRHNQTAQLDKNNKRAMNTAMNEVAGIEFYQNKRQDK